MTASAFIAVAMSRMTGGFRGRLRRATRPVQRSTLLGAIVAGERIVHFADVHGTSCRHAIRVRRAASELGGVRTHLWCRLRKDDACSASSLSLPPGGAAVLRQADRAVAEFRRAGGHRDGECAADHRDARGLGAADRDRRGIAGHQFLARRPRPGVRRDARKGACASATPRLAALRLTTASCSARSRLRERAGQRSPKFLRKAASGRS